MIKVLIIEDSIPDAFLIEEFLSESKHTQFQSEHVEMLAEAKEKLDQEPFDVVLIDLNLPDSNGTMTMQEFFETYSHIPFIILTGLSDKEVSITLLNKGAKDYLVKGDFDSNLLERAILYTLERKKIEEEHMQELLSTQDIEKERIARNVHDTLGQNLTSAVLQLENIKSQYNHQDDDIKKSLDIALHCINQAILDTRGISRSLMPQTVQKFGLESGVESIIFTLGENSPIDFNLDSNIEEYRFPEAVEINFFRIIQEGINNIMKYSKAKEATIGLRYEEENKTLHLKISDNGIGFDLNNARNNKGIGLTSMRNRAKSITARFNITSKKDQGTEINVSIKTPLRA